MKSNQFSIRANLGFVIRGPLDGLNAFTEHLEEFCKEHELTIVFKKASASRLWIKADEDDNHESG